MSEKKKQSILSPKFLRPLGPAVGLLAALILIPISGCAALDLTAPQLTSTPLPTRTKVILPPTWTEQPPTATREPSPTPTPTTSPTITMTLTPLPSPTGTVESPPGTPEPSSTPGGIAGRQTSCTYTASEPGVRIFSAPFVDPYHVLPTMEPGKPYPAVINKPTYSLLLEDGQPLGWVDYRYLAVDAEGEDCLTVYDQREITDFPLCFFTPLKEISGYTDSSFSEPLHNLAPANSFVVLYQSSSAYFSAYGSSGPSFVVKKEQVETHGSCGNIPTLAFAAVETDLYSDLPDQGGSMVYSLAVEEPLFLQSRRRAGAPPQGAEREGEWILARRQSWAEDLNGWVWSGHVEEK